MFPCSPALLRQIKYQLGTAAVINTILIVARVARSLRVVRSLRINLIGQGIVEEELRCEFVSLLGTGEEANLEMNMDGAARIPARIDRQELNRSVAVCHLIAAQVSLASRIESPVSDIGITASRVAVPDVHVSSGQRHAGAAADSGDVDLQTQLRSRFYYIGRWVCSDVGAVEFLVHKVWAFGQLRSARHKSVEG